VVARHVEDAAELALERLERELDLGKG
jgi:hypothetical protein